MSNTKDTHTRTNSAPQGNTQEDKTTAILRRFYEDLPEPVPEHERIVTVYELLRIVMGETMLDSLRDATKWRDWLEFNVKPEAELATHGLIGRRVALRLLIEKEVFEIARWQEETHATSQDNLTAESQSWQRRITELLLTARQYIFTTYQHILDSHIATSSPSTLLTFLEVAYQTGESLHSMLTLWATSADDSHLSGTKNYVHFVTIHKKAYDSTLGFYSLRGDELQEG